MRHTVQGTHITPGAELGPSKKYYSGAGTYEEEGMIHASRRGILLIDQASDGKKVGTLSVQRSTAKRADLSVGDTVFGIVRDPKLQVKAITKQAAFVEIVFQKGKRGSGKIPLSFVRSYDTSRVRMDESYVPGDRVKAKIIGHEKNVWTLSTAQEELGVVLAFSHTTGEAMVPLNWEYYVCPVSKFKEARKVAKPSED